MLVPVALGTSPINPTGLMQAWGGTLCMWKQDIVAFSKVLSYQPVHEIIQHNWPFGIGSWDGGICVIGSGGNAFVFIGPASGLTDYIAQAIIGVHGVVDAEAQAWLYTIWSSMSLDVIGPVETAVKAVLSPTGIVQLAGFSAGGAMATIIERKLRVRGLTNQMASVGFGQPRSIADSFVTLPNMISIRFCNQLDPVDKIPTPTSLVADGGPLPGLPIPTIWFDYGNRYLLMPDGSLTPQPDPGGPIALINLPQHHGNDYTKVVQTYYAAQAALGNGSQDGALYSYMAGVVAYGLPIQLLDNFIANLPPPLPPPPPPPPPAIPVIVDVPAGIGVELPPQPTYQNFITEFKIPAGLRKDPG